MKSAAKEVALCGMMTALAVVVMCIDSVVPIGLYFCPMVASLTLIIAREECRTSYAITCFFAEALLSLMLCTDKECAALLLFLGYYPLLQPIIHRKISSKPMQILIKGIFYTVSVAAMYTLLLFVIGLDSVQNDFAESGLWIAAILFVIGSVLFCMYDVMLVRVTTMYKTRRARKKNREK